MKTLKTGFFIVTITLCCLSNLQAQENARGKLKGKVVKSGDTGMISVEKDTLIDPTADQGKKGLNAVNVKLARGVDKKDIRKNDSTILLESDVPQRKGINEGGLKKNTVENAVSVNKEGEARVSQTRSLGTPSASHTNMNSAHERVGNTIEDSYSKGHTVKTKDTITTPQEHAVRTKGNDAKTSGDSKRDVR